MRDAQPEQLRYVLHAMKVQACQGLPAQPLVSTCGRTANGDKSKSGCFGRHAGLLDKCRPPAAVGALGFCPDEAHYFKSPQSSDKRRCAEPFWNLRRPNVLPLAREILCMTLRSADGPVEKMARHANSKGLLHALPIQKQSQKSGSCNVYDGMGNRSAATCHTLPEYLKAVASKPVA